MKFEIKHRYDNTVLFSMETESLKLCVEAAVKLKVDLRYADLRSANLGAANLGYANLGYAKGIIESFTIDRIGSRNGSTTFVLIKKDEVKVWCGCFSGTLVDFEKKVKETHADNEHAKAYQAAIALAKIRFAVAQEESKP